MKAFFELVFLLYVTGIVGTDGNCNPPSLVNGRVETLSVGEDTWVGSFSCSSGFILYGNSKMKCRGGVWSSSIPVCTAIGVCDPLQLPSLHNGVKRAVKAM